MRINFLQALTDAQRPSSPLHLQLNMSEEVLVHLLVPGGMTHHIRRLKPTGINWANINPLYNWLSVPLLMAVNFLLPNQIFLSHEGGRIYEDQLLSLGIPKPMGQPNQSLILVID